MNIFLAIIVLGVLIFIHELGHFLVAKACGVYVEKFSLGFGPRLIGKKIGETDYCLSAFPLGGYVKMYGEQPDETPDESKAGRSFSDKKPWQRALIILAGPSANVLLAIVVFWGLFMAGFPAYSPVVGSVEKGGPAYEAGILPGDKIEAVDGKKINSWNEFQNIITDSPDKKLVVLLSGGKEVSLTPKTAEVPDVFGDKQKVGDIGASLSIPPVIGSLQAGMPASEAGLRKGDKIASLNGKTVSSWTAAAQYIRSRPGELIKVDVLRGETPLAFELTPKPSEIKNEKGEAMKIGLVGISPIDGNIIVKYGPLESMKLGFEKSYDFTKLILIGFGKLIQRAVPADSLGGPIMIVQMAAESAQSGWTTLLIFMAAISMNLAIFNLLPIPVLDGGHLMIIGIEAVTRRKLSEKVVGGFQMAGFVLLMGLMVFAFYNDIMRFFTK